jgi:hypothetical protein
MSFIKISKKTKACVPFKIFHLPMLGTTAFCKKYGGINKSYIYKKLKLESHFLSTQETNAN